VKRTPLRPGTKRLTRHVGVRPVNRARRARLYERNFGAYSDFIRSLPCAVPGCLRRDIEAAHVVTRKMGGCGGDKTNLVPLCGPHHREEEGHLDEFNAKHGTNLRACAAHLWATYGATEKYLALVVKGNRAQVQSALGVLACGEGQG
jgi:hypothetical protein